MEKETKDEALDETLSLLQRTRYEIRSIQERVEKSANEVIGYRFEDLLKEIRNWEYELAWNELLKEMEKKEKEYANFN